MAIRGSGAVVQVDVDAFSGVVFTAISQAIRQHSSGTASNSAGIATATPGAGQPQSIAARSGTSSTQVQLDGQGSSGRKRRYWKKQYS
jgi:hypothetical protein